MSATDPLIHQYEQWSYPAPIHDLKAYVSAGGHDLSDPSRIRRKLWPCPIEPDTLHILVAGCGANQAAVLAHANPQHHVVGIDLSTQAIDHHRKLKVKHGLANLELHQIALEEIGMLDRHFDLIISTGVLHHLREPATGLAALQRALAPHGVMSLMLYGKYARTGVYMVQEAMRAMGVQQNAPDLAFAKETVNQLPPWHAARPYQQSAPDIQYDAGFIDTFLNARDRAYSIPEIMELVAGAGLRFQSWLDGLHYSPSAIFPADSPIHDRIELLPLEQQWHVVDLLTQRIGAHRFLVCQADRPDNTMPPDLWAAVEDGTWLDLVPHKHPDLRVTNQMDGTINLEREWHSIQLPPDEAMVFHRVDGTTPFRGLLQNTNDDSPEFLGGLFSELTEWGHIYVTRHPKE